MCIENEDFLNESLFNHYIDDFLGLDDYFYQDVHEFQENVLSQGCIQKRKKRIYDEYEYDNEDYY